MRDHTRSWVHDFVASIGSGQVMNMMVNAIKGVNHVMGLFFFEVVLSG